MDSRLHNYTVELEMNSLRSILTLLFSTLEKLISMHSSLLCISETRGSKWSDVL